jgi:O-Antigen ligase
MKGSVQLPRKIVVLAVVLPLAAVLGVLLATPQDLSSLAGLGIILGVLSLPILLRWHHPILVFSWNAAAMVFILPGQPSLWMLMACISLFFSVLANVLDRNAKLQQVPALTWAMAGLALVVVVTAQLTGGIGLRSFGGNTYGGKKYFLLLFAIIGYFALSCQKIPVSKAKLYVSIFLLAGLTIGLGNLAYLGGEGFWWLFYILPPDYVTSQASEDFFGDVGALKFSRLSGMTWAGLSAFSYLLVRYRLQGLIDFSKPWRFLTAALIFALSLLGGFRSIVVIYALLVACQFYFEGLFRTRVFPMLLMLVVVAVALLFPFARSLPLSVQRSLSVIPLIEVHPAAQADAAASTDWRLRMWQVLLPEIPKYLFLGKGFTASATDYYLALESFKRGLSEDTEMSLIAGDYHNGPLSILIPFGIWGLLAFLAFIVAALRLLYHNCKHGPPPLQSINTFLLSYFVARLIYFFTVFGGISSDIWLFAGLVGMSVSLNGGYAPVLEPARVPAREVSVPETGLIRA